MFLGRSVQRCRTNAIVIFPHRARGAWTVVVSRRCVTQRSNYINISAFSRHCHPKQLTFVSFQLLQGQSTQEQFMVKGLVQRQAAGILKHKFQVLLGVCQTTFDHFFPLRIYHTVSNSLLDSLWAYQGFRCLYNCRTWNFGPGLIQWRALGLKDIEGLYGRKVCKSCEALRNVFLFFCGSLY